jgi:hypothetical protein
MDGWLFCEKLVRDGVAYRLGKRGDDPAVYRFEPLGVPLRGWQAGRFNKTLQQRSQVLGVCQNQGLLSALGPVRYEKLVWVGWQDPGGDNPFQGTAGQTDLPRTIQDLLPVIRAYELVHLAGLVIGPPDWGRLTHNDQGYQLPDPWLKEYLACPERELPPGLTAVYPPELSQCAPLGQTADCFYLGLLLYSLLSDKIPYPLKNNWPQGLITRRSIPLTHFLPQINPQLSNLIADLLAPDPEERPSVREVRWQWQKNLNQSLFLATPHEYRRNRQASRRYDMGIRLDKWFARVKLSLGIIAFLGLLAGCYSWWQNRPGPSAEQIVTELFASPFLATSLINPSGCADLVSRLTREKNRRAALIRELSFQPYVKIKAIKRLARSPRKTELELTLEWWTWEPGRFRKTVNQERFVLAKARKTWKIQRTQLMTASVK